MSHVDRKHHEEGRRDFRMVNDIFNGEMPMDLWIKNKIGLGKKEALLREDLEAYQLQMLAQTKEYATENSPYYKEALAAFSKVDLKSFKDFQKIPFMAQEDIKEKGPQIVCVGQNEISRIVTLDTSGSSGSAKRIYFTEEDQELTIDFFDHGMRNMIDESDCVMILMPYQRPGSIGDLLAQGIQRLGAQWILQGFITELSDLPKVAQMIQDKNITAIVGTPKQVEKLMDYSKGQVTGIRTVLLSAEFVDEDLKQAITKGWGCKVFEHYGMTEMGLGGAVSCYLLEGYHLRENDLYVEIINPKTHEVLADGEWGEIVFTTLTRKAMPLIRYKTGDTGRVLPDPCKCGSVLKRLDRVKDRGIRKNYEKW